MWNLGYIRGFLAMPSCTRNIAVGFFYASVHMFHDFASFLCHRECQPNRRVISLSSAISIGPN